MPATTLQFVGGEAIQLGELATVHQFAVPGREVPPGSTIGPRAIRTLMLVS